MPLFSGRTILGVVAVVALILGGFVLRDVEYPGVGDVDFPWVDDACSANPSYRRSLLDASGQHMRRVNDLQSQAATAFVAGRGDEAAARLADVASESEALASGLGAVEVPDYKRAQRDRAIVSARAIATAARAVGTQAGGLGVDEFAAAAAPLDDAAADYNERMRVLVDTSRGCA